ncbi:MAG: hypothetical protein ACOX7A_09920, partial [Lawsonibacter sp.]
EMSANDPSGLSMTMTASMKNDKMEMNMEIDDTMMDMTMTMDGVYRRSSAKPAGAPPAGAEVVDVMDLILSMMDDSGV